MVLFIMLHMRGFLERLVKVVGGTTFFLFKMLFSGKLTMTPKLVIPCIKNQTLFLLTYFLQMQSFRILIQTANTIVALT